MKKAIILGGIGIAALFAFGGKKVAQINNSFKNLRVKINGIKNLSFTGNSITFNLDINLINSGGIPIDVATYGTINLRRLIFKDSNGTVIGESYPNITGINIPAYNSVRFQSVPTSIPISNIGIAATTLLKSFSNPALLQINPEIETPAGIYLIGS